MKNTVANVLLWSIFNMALYSIPVQAEVGGNQVFFKGRLVAPLACTVNDDADSNVNFGKEIITTRIDGVNYKQKASYSIVCKGNVNNLIKMRLGGRGTDFDAKAVLTTNKDIGVAMYTGTTRIGVNEWINITYPGLPEISMVPVKRPGIELKGGSFSGYVKFTLEYQ